MHIQDMIFERFYNMRLAQASFLIGCERTHEAIVVDPNRHFDAYIKAADRLGLRIDAVTETHIHADYLSGSRELAEITGAKLYLSGEGGPDWRYEFAHEAGAVLVRHGDEIRIGDLGLQVLHTPGHTPEHIAFVLPSPPAPSPPEWEGGFMLTGDFVFIGDVGRPDLLECAAGYKDTMAPAARQLYRSLRLLDSIGDEMCLWPGHGAGSACGKALGADPSATLAEQRAINWALRCASEDDFVGEVLSGQPEPPRYFAEMKRLNRLGPPRYGYHAPREISETPEDAVMVDVRRDEEFALGHAPMSYCIPLRGDFVTWAGSILPYGKPIVLIVNNESEAAQAARDLMLIGLDDVVGWRAPSPSDVAVTEATTFDRALAAGSLIVDVRSGREWSEGHVEEAVHIPISQLLARAGELPMDRPIAVHCEGGARSPVAASVLQSLGYQVADIQGGYASHLMGAQIRLA